MYESGTRLPAPCRRSSPACLSQLVLWLGLVMVVQGGALPSFFGGPSSSTSGTDKPGLPPLVWYVQLPHAAVHVYPSYPRRLYPDEAPGVESKLLFENPQVFDPHFSCVCVCVCCAGLRRSTRVVGTAVRRSPSCRPFSRPHPQTHSLPYNR